MLETRAPGSVVSSRLSALRTAVPRISGLQTIANLVVAAPREACRAAGAARALFSFVEGDRIVPASVEAPAEAHIAPDFLRVGRHARPPLAACPPEERAVRDLRPVAVCVDGPTLVYRPLTSLCGTAAYAVAPVVCDQRAVALLHADGFTPEGVVRREHVEALGIVAACLGVAYGQLREQPGTLGLATALPVEVAAGTPQLTSREFTVLQLLADGVSNAEIAERLVIAETTVKSHVSQILRKLGAQNRTEAARFYFALREAA